MASVLSGLLSLRRDPRLLKLPPYLSGFCVLVGLVWLSFLPLDSYSRSTYISENALLPGQVHTYFGGSEHNVFRAYRQEVGSLDGKPESERCDALVDILKSQGLKVATQDFRYERAGEIRSGRNVYAVLQGPRADATEAMVLIGPWRNMDNKINYSGVALVLTLARYFKRWSLWSKDIIILIPSDSVAGPQAWIDAYHDTHDPKLIQSLSIKAGALQGALAIDYPAGIWGHRFDKLHIVYDGVNGQLPNLDLVNTAVSVANGQMGISCTMQRKWHGSDRYRDRLMTMLRGMATQAVGFSSGAHSSFMPYHIDAITLQAVGDGWQDEMSLGRSVEGIFRSLNNLLEHLHQSFFFYLLMESRRFVSIGTYLPSAMLVAANFSIMAIALWIQSGRTGQLPAATSDSGMSKGPKAKPKALVKSGGSVAVIVAPTDSEIAKRSILLPMAVVVSLYALGLIPLFASDHITEKPSLSLALAIGSAATLLPFALVQSIISTLLPTRQEATLIHCLSLLVLGAMLSTLATLNFAQSLFIGVLASPLSFIGPVPSQNYIKRAAWTGLLIAISPLTVLSFGNWASGRTWWEMLLMAAWARTVERAWTSIAVWIVWWPAWICGLLVLSSGDSEKGAEGT